MDIILKLDEQEARALMGLTEYGEDAFLEIFYTKMGKTPLKPHEGGLRSLFRTLKAELPQHLKKMDKARAALQDEKK